MEERIMTDLKTKIQSFLIDAVRELRAEGDGCRYMRLDDETGLCLVVAYDGDRGGARAKIAFNADSLQSDYDFDWDEPILRSTGEAYDTDIRLFELTANKDAQWFKSNYDALFRLYKNGKLR